MNRRNFLGRIGITLAAIAAAPYANGADQGKVPAQYRNLTPAQTLAKITEELGENGNKAALGSKTLTIPTEEGRIISRVLPYQTTGKSLELTVEYNVGGEWRPASRATDDGITGNFSRQVNFDYISNEPRANGIIGNNAESNLAKSAQVEYIGKIQDALYSLQ